MGRGAANSGRIVICSWQQWFNDGKCRGDKYAVTTTIIIIIIRGYNRPTIMIIIIVIRGYNRPGERLETSKEKHDFFFLAGGR